RTEVFQNLSPLSDHAVIVCCPGPSARQEAWMYREVTMIELREVLRLWQEHLPKKRIAARLGLDPKTVRRYLRAAEAAGLPAQPSAVSDEQLRDVLLALQPSPRRGLDPLPRTAGGDPARSEERRVGKERRSRRSGAEEEKRG